MAATSATASGLVARARASATSLREWTVAVKDELAHLPTTLVTVREAGENIHRVSTDLTDVAAALNRVTKALDSAGMVEAFEAFGRTSESLRAASARMEAANKAFEESVGRLPGGDLLKPWFRGGR